MTNCWCSTSGCGNRCWSWSRSRWSSSSRTCEALEDDAALLENSLWIAEEEEAVLVLGSGSAILERKKDDKSEWEIQSKRVENEIQILALSLTLGIGGREGAPWLRWIEPSMEPERESGREKLRLPPIGLVLRRNGSWEEWRLPGVGDNRVWFSTTHV